MTKIKQRELEKAIDRIGGLRRIIMRTITFKSITLRALRARIKFQCGLDIPAEMLLPILDHDGDIIVIEDDTDFGIQKRYCQR